MELGFVPAALGQVTERKIPCATDGCREVAAQLPSCYSERFFECSQDFLQADKEKKDYPSATQFYPELTAYCTPIWNLRASRRADYDAAVDAMGYCPEPGAAAKGTSGGLLVLGAIGVAAVAAAFLLLR